MLQQTIYARKKGMDPVQITLWTGHGLYGTNFSNKGMVGKGTVRRGQVRTGRERSGVERTGKARKPIKFASRLIYHAKPD